MFYLSFGHNSLHITNSNNLQTSLQINYYTLQMKQTFTHIEHNNMITFYSLLGIIFIRKRAILVVASEVNKFATIGISIIYQVKRVNWIPVAHLQEHEHILNEVDTQIIAMQQLFSEGYHYYSDTYDLSRPYLLNNIITNTMEQLHFYQQFIWNMNLIRLDYHNNNFYNGEEGFKHRQYDNDCWLLKKWAVRLIQGFLQEFITELPNNLMIRYLLISRRSYKKAGTRFYARGVDDQGNVANFIESQQILFFKDFIFTHLQIRGSVPVFFEQLGVNGLTSQLNIQRTRPFTKKAFSAHFKTLQKIYRRVLCINLLSLKNAQQVVLVNFYQEMISTEVEELTFVRYQFFDFHQECKSDKFQNTQMLIEKIRQLLLAFGFNCYNISTRQFLSRQSGVSRTNCLDCLDRTNYVQSRIALTLLKHFLHCFNDPHNRQLIQEQRIFQMPASQQYPLLYNFNGMWAQNGDIISLQYTGIGSTHTDITRTGKRTLAGTVTHKMKSLMRFYTQFTDAKKHQAINRLVGNKTIKKYIKRTSRQINQFHNSLIYSINLTHSQITHKSKMSSQIGKIQPSIIVVFIFQQDVKDWMSKLKRVLSNQEQDRLKQYEQEIDVIVVRQKYCAVAHTRDNGCCLTVFVKHHLVQYVQHVKKESLSSELSYNQQVLLIKLTLHRSSLIFAGVNCTQYSTFISILDQIHDKAFQINQLGNYMSSSMLQQHFRVVVGNIGSKTRLSNQTISQFRLHIARQRQRGDKIKVAKLIGQLLDYDQHSQPSMSNNNRYLHHYSEGPVEFIPQNNRILFWNQEGLIVRVLGYGELDRGWLMGMLSYEINK